MHVMGCGELSIKFLLIYFRCAVESVTVYFIFPLVHRFSPSHLARKVDNVRALLSLPSLFVIRVAVDTFIMVCTLQTFNCFIF